MKPRDLFDLVKDTYNVWSEAKAPRLGAALAYYSVFSIAPLLILVLAVAGWVFGKEAAERRLAEQIQSLVGPEIAQAVQKLVENAADPGAGWVAAAVSLVTLLLGAMGAFVQLQDALNTIWGVAPKPGRTLRATIKDRILSFAMVLTIGFLLLVSLAISAALSFLDHFLTPSALPGGATLWQGVNAVVSFAFVTLLFAMIYKVLPDVRVAWRDVWLGAAVTALLFSLGKYLLALYLGRRSVTSAFGAAGSLVLILLWVYYSSQVLLLGAAFTRAFARKYGTPVVPDENAEFVTPGTEASQGVCRPQAQEASER
jgi:membrane protein